MVLKTEPAVTKNILKNVDLNFIAIIFLIYILKDLNETARRIII